MKAAPCPAAQMLSAPSFSVVAVTSGKLLHADPFQCDVSPLELSAHSTQTSSGAAAEMSNTLVKAGSVTRAQPSPGAPQAERRSAATAAVIAFWRFMPVKHQGRPEMSPARVGT